MKASFRQSHACITVYFPKEYCPLVKEAAKRVNLSVNGWVRACVIDGLVDEGYDLNAIRRVRSTRYQTERERAEVSGGTAS